MTVKERPILFSGPMVRAILDGRKTQTRRVVKPQPPHTVIEGLAHVTIGMDPAEDGRIWYDADCINPGREMRCPYGRIGERLWVRETWQTEVPGMTAEPDDTFHYREDFHDDPHGYDGEKSPEGRYRTWRPSIFMPRFASRITLEVTDVRVERLQDITEADAIAEGAQCAGFPASLSNVGAFGKLWDKLNGKRGFGWATNPWLWVVSFKRLEVA